MGIQSRRQPLSRYTLTCRAGAEGEALSGNAQKEVTSGLKALDELSSYQTTEDLRNYVFAVGTALRAGKISNAEAKKLLQVAKVALRRLVKVGLAAKTKSPEMAGPARPRSETTLDYEISWREGAEIKTIGSDTARQACDLAKALIDHGKAGVEIREPILKTNTR